MVALLADVFWRVSLPLLGAWLALLLLRIAVGAAFAWHACRVVFNRRPPRSLSARVSALAALLRVTRPLELVWRLLTAPLRSLPDLYILGEVRCGTTTTASLLRTHLRMHGPFTPWVHPLAEHKESFFFSGHYWRVVEPALYRLCFPLSAVRWLRRALGQPHLAFDGCASYLSSPWAPRLLKAVTPRPVLVVCLREPVAQHLSWWRLEQSSMAWAQQLGLGSDFLPPPSRLQYPPRTLAEAVRLSRSEEVQQLWRRAELLPAQRELLSRLPEWAAPFPNGQLSTFDRMGRYADSLERWFALFPPECFVFVGLDELERDPHAVLERISAALRANGSAVPPLSHSPAVDELRSPRLNQSAPLDKSLEPDEATLRELAAYYRPHNERLFGLIGRDLGWHESCPWYDAAQGAQDGLAVR